MSNAPGRAKRSPFANMAKQLYPEDGFKNAIFDNEELNGHDSVESQPDNATGREGAQMTPMQLMADSLYSSERQENDASEGQNPGLKDAGGQDNKPSADTKGNSQAVESSDCVEEDSDETGQMDPKVIDARVQSIKQNYEKIINRGRQAGYDVAADNLEHFMKGSGEPKEISSDWLRGYHAVRAAESRLKDYAINHRDEMPVWLAQMRKDGVKQFNGHWDAGIEPSNPLSELTYASGGSNLVGTTSMTLARQGDVISVNGTLNVHWSDKYNWNKGQGIDIPIIGRVSDDDGLFLEKHGGAKSFDMHSGWQWYFYGKYDIAAGKWISQDWSLNQ